MARVVVYAATLHQLIYLSTPIFLAMKPPHVTRLVLLLVFTLSLLWQCSSPKEEIVPAPVAAFSYTPSSALIAPAQVEFYDESKNATAYEWTFGDGEKSISREPSHTFQQAGTYTVQLKVSNKSGSNTTTQQLVVQAPAPQTGTQSFWVKSDLGVGAISVSIDSKSEGTITHFHANGLTCGQGDVNITRTPGTYAYKATSATGTASWEGSFTVVAGKCASLELVLTATGNSACAGWRQRYGGFHDDELRKVLPLADGGFLLAGKSKSTIESGSRYTRKSLNAILGVHGGIDDLWITRIGTDGKALWDIGLDIYHKERLGVATIGNEFLDIIQTRDGGFAMVGIKSDSLKLFKMSASGSFLWAKTFFSPTFYNSFIRQTPTGDLLIAAGQVPSGTIRNDPKIVCLRADGSIRWEQSYSITSLTVSNVTFDNALPTPGGGYICTAPIGADKTLAVKIDGSGNKLWEKLLPKGRVTGEAPDGSFLLVDNEDKGGVNSHPSAPFYVPLGARAIRVDQNGIIVWDRFIRSKKSVNTKKIDSFHTATYVDGNYLIGGVTNDNGEPQMWLLKLDDSGNMKWEMAVDEDTGYQFAESRGVMYLSVSNVFPTVDGGFFIGATQSEKFYATPIDPASYPGLNFLGIKVKTCSLNNGRLAAPAPLRPAH